MLEKYIEIHENRGSMETKEKHLLKLLNLAKFDQGKV
jgi:hypothetical protein